MGAINTRSIADSIARCNEKRYIFGQYNCLPLHYNVNKHNYIIQAGMYSIVRA